MLTLASAAEAEMALHLLSARLRDAVSIWETLIWELSRVPERPTRRGGDRAAQLVRLEAALAEAEREAEAMRQIAAEEDAAAAGWRRRALLAMVQGRDDLARQCAARLREHREAGRTIAYELIRLEALAAAFRETLAAMPPAEPPEPGARP